MSHPDSANFIAKAVVKNCPEAVQCADPFHVVKWATEEIRAGQVCVMSCSDAALEHFQGHAGGLPCRVQRDRIRPHGIRGVVEGQGCPLERLGLQLELGVERLGRARSTRGRRGSGPVRRPRTAPTCAAWSETRDRSRSDPRERAARQSRPASGPRRRRSPAVPDRRGHAWGVGSSVDKALGDQHGGVATAHRFELAVIHSDHSPLDLAGNRKLRRSPTSELIHKRHRVPPWERQGGRPPGGRLAVAHVHLAGGDLPREPAFLADFAMSSGDGDGGGGGHKGEGSCRAGLDAQGGSHEQGHRRDHDVGRRVHHRT